MSKKTKKQNKPEEMEPVKTDGTNEPEDVKEGFFKRKLNAAKEFCSEHKKGLIGAAVGIAGAVGGSLYLLNGLGTEDDVTTDFETEATEAESESPVDE